MSRVKGWQFLLVVPVFFLTQGCASIIKGTTQSIPIASDPSGADILIDGKVMGQTPKSLALKRKGTYVITIQKPGFEQQSVPIVRNIGGAVWGNAIAGGLIGWGFDAASGAQYNLSPESVAVKLLPVSTAAKEEKPDDPNSLVSQLKALDQLYDSGQMSGEEYVNIREALFKKYMHQAPPADNAPPTVAPPATPPATYQATQSK